MASSTSSMEISIPSARIFSIILRIRGSRPSRVSSSTCCISLCSGSKSIPNICTLTPSFVRQDISEPSTNFSEPRSDSVASAHPEVVSWSDIPKSSKPWTIALLTSSRGESVPSLQVVWVCRSITLYTSSSSHN